MNEISIYDLYVAPKFPFDERYAHLCAINFGASPAGARRHYETMQHCPDGHIYYGKVERSKASSDAVIHDTAYSIDGELMSDYVVVFRNSVRELLSVDRNNNVVFADDLTLDEAKDLLRDLSIKSARYVPTQKPKPLPPH